MSNLSHKRIQSSTLPSIKRKTIFTSYHNEFQYLNSQFQAASVSISAFDLAKEQRLHFAGEVTNIMRLARKKKWALQEEKRLNQEIELQINLNHLLEAEKNA